MKTKLILTSIFLFGIFLTSCSDHLTGSWTIHKYTTTKKGEADVLLSNIGTITFYKNGNGEKNIKYTLFDVMKNDNSLFKWEITDNFIKIESKGSEFSKTWILIENTKNFQKWQTTDGSNQIVILELKKIKK